MRLTRPQRCPAPKNAESPPGFGQPTDIAAGDDDGADGWQEERGREGSGKGPLHVYSLHHHVGACTAGAPHPPCPSDRAPSYPLLRRCCHLTQDGTHGGWTLACTTSVVPIGGNRGVLNENTDGHLWGWPSCERVALRYMPLGGLPAARRASRRGSRGLASLTVSVRPSISWPWSLAMAVRAAVPSGISTKPKPWSGRCRDP